MSYTLIVTANLPGGMDWSANVFDTIAEAESHMVEMIEATAYRNYDIAPHGFEKITAIIKDQVHGGDPVVTLICTREMFETSHKGQVTKLAPCGCWLTVGAGRWQSNNLHNSCEKQVQANFQM